MKPLALYVPRGLLTESAKGAAAESSQIRNIGDLFERQSGMPSSHY